MRKVRCVLKVRKVRTNQLWYKGRVLLSGSCKRGRSYKWMYTVGCTQPELFCKDMMRRYNNRMISIMHLLNTALLKYRVHTANIHSVRYKGVMIVVIQVSG